MSARDCHERLAVGEFGIAAAWRAAPRLYMPRRWLSAATETGTGPSIRLGPPCHDRAMQAPARAWDLDAASRYVLWVGAGAPPGRGAWLAVLELIGRGVVTCEPAHGLHRCVLAAGTAAAPADGPLAAMARFVKERQPVGVARLSRSLRMRYLREGGFERAEAAVALERRGLFRSAGETRSGYSHWEPTDAGLKAAVELERHLKALRRLLASDARGAATVVAAAGSVLVLAPYAWDRAVAVAPHGSAIDPRLLTALDLTRRGLAAERFMYGRGDRSATADIGGDQSGAAAALGAFISGA
jgi:hypothetical protein